MTKANDHSLAEARYSREIYLTQRALGEDAGASSIFADPNVSAQAITTFNNDNDKPALTAGKRMYSKRAKVGVATGVVGLLAFLASQQLGVPAAQPTAQPTAQPAPQVLSAADAIKALDVKVKAATLDVDAKRNTLKEVEQWNDALRAEPREQPLTGLA